MSDTQVRFGGREERGAQVGRALVRTFDWLAEIARPAPGLGRRGAVCPYIEKATQAGQVSLVPLALDCWPDPLAALTAAVWRAVERVALASLGSSVAELILPWGLADTELAALVTEAQAATALTANGHGCMVGEFYPGHPGPGLHNPDFRPLDSTTTILGVRRMVEIDIAFLEHVEGTDREARLLAWHAGFGATASSASSARYHAARDSSAE